MTNVVFHLGDKKTGSTAIQTALASGAVKSPVVSLLYPGARKVSHIALAKALQRPKAMLEVISTQFRELTQEIRTQNPDRAVISAEAFEDVDPTKLREMVQKYMPDYADGARYIAYVRPHSERLTSDYAERVKAGYLGSMEDLFASFQKSRVIEYTPRFIKWREVFGENFELRPMIRGLLYQNDVVADVVKYVLGTENFTIGQIPNPNEATSLENLAILRRMHSAMQGESDRRLDFQKAFGRDIARRMSKSVVGPATKVQIHRSLAEAVMDRMMPDAERLDAEFFSGTPMADNLRAAPGRALEAAQSLEIDAHFSAREQHLIGLWIDQMLALVKVDPKRWADALRSSHKVEVLSGQADEDSGIRVRTMRGRKGQRAMGAGSHAGTVAGSWGAEDTGAEAVAKTASENKAAAPTKRRSKRKD